MWHLKVIMIVIISHVLIENKFKLVDIMKTVITHMLVGLSFTLIVNAMFIFMGPVGVGGGLSNNS